MKKIVGFEKIENELALFLMDRWYFISFLKYIAKGGLKSICQYFNLFWYMLLWTLLWYN